MDWDKVKDTLLTVAPGIAGALGGPLAGVAVHTLAKALGADGEDNPEQAVVDLIATGDPEVLLKAKQADKQFVLECKRLDVEDRSSARDMAKSQGIAVQAILSAVFVVAFAAALWLVFSGQNVIHSEMKETAIFLLGILSGGIGQILNFWFGSSEGSKQKTAHFGRAIK